MKLPLPIPLRSTRSKRPARSKRLTKSKRATRSKRSTRSILLSFVVISSLFLYTTLMLASVSGHTGIVKLHSKHSTRSAPNKENTNPPKPMKKPHKMEIHGDVRVDDYFWMKQRKNPAVLEHLKAENAYADSELAQTRKLHKKLFKEMKGREKKKDSSVPVFENGYYYSSKYKKKSEYPIVVRRKDSLDSPEEVILDANKLAEGTSFFGFRGFRDRNWKVSPNGSMLAYATDTVGRGIYTIYFKNLNTRKTLSSKIEKVNGIFQWASDNKTLFYTKQNPITLRSESVYSYNFDTQKSKLVYHEKDDKFLISIGKTTSQKYLLIYCGSTESTEYLLIDADKPNQKPRLFSRREKKHEYSISHAGDFFFVSSNKGATNFKVFKTPSNQKTDSKHWQTYLEHRPSVLIKSMNAFKDYLVLAVQKNGVNEIEVINRSNKNLYTVEHPEKSHFVWPFSNPNYDTPFLRYHYSSMTTPLSTIDLDLETKSKTVRKVKAVLGGFDKNNYVSERITATSKDGVQIPITLVYRKDVKKGSKTPLLLYGYGSYGYNIDPYFSSSRLSLLDRGFIYAVAHIRGSSTMGKKWYLEGKYLKKKNTFEDFIASAEHLIRTGYTGEGHIYAMGGSAGGLLMGAVVNMRPTLFKGVVAKVPFVDIVTTMLDDSIPLTTNEYEEWGNPNTKKYYDYMKSYSPYDNIKRQAYPNMLVTSGFHDSQVQYWEPTKWVAKLRDFNTSNNKILLSTNLEAGHRGKSGRFQRLDDKARNYAFLLKLEEENSRK